MLQKPFTLYCICLIFLFSCGNVKKESVVINPNATTFKETNFGLTESQTYKGDPQPNSPTGFYVESRNFRFTKKTNIIPAKLNTQFGVEYVFNSKTTHNITISSEWVFPSTMTNKEGKKFDKLSFDDLSISTNDTRHSTYVFENDYEIIKGNWYYRIFFKGKMIYQKTFIVQ